jgi:hypothetical protein
MKVNFADFKAQLAKDAGIELKPEAGKCGMAKCKGDGTATKFTDEMSQREYRISGLCQACQDVVFAEPTEECGEDVPDTVGGPALSCTLDFDHQGDHKHEPLE